jgi:asparagine synthase (glutamine-hydrolysing)
MCGIAGIVGSRVPEDRLWAVAGTMHHRGPDQSGIFLNDRIGFSHCRLSIIDLSQMGQQPMSGSDGKTVIVFNGEIYNFQALRKELITDVPFRSNSDTEVLLRGYEVWGISKLLEKINGMFAFAIWDDANQVLHVARDRCGKKPLFYHYRNGTFCFASTLQALLMLMGTTPSVSWEAVAHYLNYLSVPSPMSIFEGICKLPPACRLEFRLGKDPEIERYWQLSFVQKENLSEIEWVERIDATLRAAVAERLIADVPIGTFLSGGVDSSIVTSMMADISGKQITTISIGFQEEDYNELKYARQVARKWNTDHHEYVVEPASVIRLPHIIHQFGEPFADHSALPCYILSKIARQHATVVLTGDGGDEGFGGYESARVFSLYPYLKYLAGRPMLSIARRLRNAKTDSNTIKRKLHWLTEIYSSKNGNYPFDPVGTRNFRFLRDQLFASNLREVASQEKLDELYTAVWNSRNTIDWADRSFLLDFERKLPDVFLTKVDVTTMAHSLEARSPFLDYRLLELAARIPSSIKINARQAKWLLKKVAEKYVPKEVIYRRKQGFAVPLDAWFRNELYDLAETLLLSKNALQRGCFQPEGVRKMLSDHRHAKCAHGQRIWSMLILELWFRIFVDRDMSPEDELIHH